MTAHCETCAALLLLVDLVWLEQLLVCEDCRDRIEDESS